MSLDSHVQNQVIIEVEIESIKEEVVGIKQEVVDIKNELDSDLCNQEVKYEVELSSVPLKTDCLSLPGERLSVPGVKQEQTVEQSADEQIWYSANHESTLNQEEQVYDFARDHVQLNEASSTCEKSNAADTPNQQPKVQKRFIIITEQNSNKNRISTAANTYPCNICGKELKGKTYLRRHKRIHGDKPYSCDICHKKFTQKGNLNSHKRIHTGEKPYPCDTCDKVFTELGHLKRHIRTHTGAKPYVCEICDKTFKQTAHLTRHKLIHSGDRPYTCDICDKTFSRSFHLQRHAQVHTEDNDYFPKLTQITLLNNKKVHSEISEPRIYTCGTCNKEFLHASHLRTHARIHKGEKPYSCDLCDKKFRQLGQLKVHKEAHTGAKPYHCDICNVKFTLLGNLKRHIKRAHNHRESSDQVP